MLAQLCSWALPLMLENMEVTANNTVEMTNKPDKKLKIPLTNSEPIRMSLFKSVIGFNSYYRLS